MRSVFFAFALLGSLIAAPARAAPPKQPPPVVDAGPTPEMRMAELKAKADASMDERHYDEAIAGYTAAFEVFPDPALLYNRSRAHEARGEYPEAFGDMEKFADTASPELRQRVPRLTELLLDLRNRVAELELSCNVVGARVLLGGKEIGTTPLKPMRVNAGRATLEILMEGQFPFKKEIELKGAGKTAIDVSLSAKATNGLLAIKTTPDGATVLVDGKPFGRAPTEGLLVAGNHIIVATAEGYTEGSTQTVLVAGDRRELSLSLSKKSILKSPWFWTVIGVVVAGAAIGITAAVVLERSADSGSGFSPGQVAAPLTF